MPKPLVINVPHQLSKAQARERLDRGLARLGDQFGAVAGDLKHGWSGDRMIFSLTALGQAISGHIDVFEDEARIEVLLPGVLGLIAGKIGGRLKQEGQVLLEKK